MQPCTHSDITGGSITWLLPGGRATLMSSWTGMYKAMSVAEVQQYMLADRSCLLADMHFSDVGAATLHFRSTPGSMAR